MKDITELLQASFPDAEMVVAGGADAIDLSVGSSGVSLGTSLADITVSPQGGVLPNIQAILLPKK